MADRIFSFLILVVSIIYLVMAYTVIKAPFQYDPLGPESWPKLLGIVAIACSLYILAKPDVVSLKTTQRTALRIAILIALLFAYAWLFQPLGFIFATFLFCVSLSIILGAKPASGALFGAITGVAGYFVCTELLELNLPAGILNQFL